jgi:hypothetical protein
MCPVCSIIDCRIRCAPRCAPVYAQASLARVFDKPGGAAVSATFTHGRIVDNPRPGGVASVRSTGVSMSRIWTPIACAIALAAAMPAHAQVAYTDEEVASFAAKWQDIDFAQEDRICHARKYAKALKAGREAFVQAHPGFAAALAFSAARPEAVEATTRKLRDVQNLHDSLGAVIAFMPPADLAHLCNGIVKARPNTDFARRIDQARELLAKDVPPAPEEQVTTLAAGDVTPVVAAVLQHAEVAMYLHPDLPGRVPVHIELAAPYDTADVRLELYGMPVRQSRDGDRTAVQLTLKPHGERVKVEVKYDPEGIFGSVDVERVDGTWKATGAKIYE